ncbi:MAG: ATP-binding protein [Pseudomonadota bacterium]
MVFKHFALQLGARVALICLAAFACAWLLVQPGMYASLLLMLGVMAALTVELWRFVGRTNLTLARFLQAYRHGDATFKADKLIAGSGFEELGESISGILQRLQSQRAQQEADSRSLRALIDHTPVPLITLHPDQSVTLQNLAARRLFGASRITRLKDLYQFGPEFHRAAMELLPGESQLLTLNTDDWERHCTLSVAEYMTPQGAHRLLSLQDIHGELNNTQVKAWQDLVRVLTHEIMNSITPITSLSATAQGMAEDLRSDIEAGTASPSQLNDLSSALQTIARRSDGLLQFVDGYRHLTRMPPPEKRRVAIDSLVGAAIQLFEAQYPGCSETIQSEVSPTDLIGILDRELVEPVMLNLLRNAWQATEASGAPDIRIRAFIGSLGKLVIEVSDNGPGVSRENRHKVFVPFFTTKTGGSGVGLALAQQVMTAHDGHIRYADREGGGARFSLIF